MAKLKRLGFAPKIKFLRFATIDKEKEEISWWKSQGCKLTNYLPGGECGPILKGTKQKPQHVKNAGMAKRKTTPEQDEYIRKSYLNKEKKMAELAKEFEINRVTVMRIIYGRVNGFEKKENIQRQSQGKRKLDKNNIEKIFKLKGVLSQSELSRIFGIHQSVISEILSGKRYRSYSEEIRKTLIK